MKVRKYNSEDKQRMKELIRISVAGIDEAYSEEEIIHLENVIPEMVAGFAEEELFEFYLALEGDKLLGCAGLNIESGKVAGIFVDPLKQHEGIGTKLMEKVEDRAREENLEKMKATASISAVDFYRKLGFALIEKDKSEIEGKHIPVYRMEKRL